MNGGIGFVDRYNSVDPRTWAWTTFDLEEMKSNVFVPRKVLFAHRLDWGDESGMGFNEAYIIAPYWLLLSGVAALATLPWIRQLRLRFSLRTLLIAITLIAVVLGCAVYITR
jgi:hypothetical protein